MPSSATPALLAPLTISSWRKPNPTSPKAALPPRTWSSWALSSCGTARHQIPAKIPPTGPMALAISYQRRRSAREGFSMYIAGAITDKRRASQVVPIYKSSDSTYILSGWAQAYSAPNCASASEMKGDNSEKQALLRPHRQGLLYQLQPGARFPLRPPSTPTTPTGNMPPASWSPSRKKRHGFHHHRHHGL